VTVIIQKPSGTNALFSLAQSVGKFLILCVYFYKSNQSHVVFAKPRTAQLVCLFVSFHLNTFFGM